MIKTSKQVERHIKGVANHKRIEMILLIRKYPSIVMDSITERLNMNYFTAGDHASKLVSAGLVSKKRNKENMEYSISPYGKIFCKFIDEFMTIR